MNPKRNCRTIVALFSLVAISILFSTLPRSQCASILDLGSKIFSARAESLNGADKNWNLAIGKVDEANRLQMMCGGVMTRSEQLIASASCLDHNNLVRDWSTVQVRDVSNGIYEITSMTLHPNYTGSSVVDDIAVLTITPRVQVSESDSVPAQRHHFSYDEVLNNAHDQMSSNIIVSNSDDPLKLKQDKSDAPLSSVLLVTTMVPPEICDAKYREYMFKKAMDFDAAFPRGIDITLLCATVSSVPPCELQRGWQLIAIRPDHKQASFTYYLLGTRTRDTLLSPDPKDCDARALPMVFTNTMMYQDWIDSLVTKSA